VLTEHFFETLTSFTVSIWAQGGQNKLQTLFGLATNKSYSDIALDITATAMGVYFRRSYAVM